MFRDITANAAVSPHKYVFSICAASVELGGFSVSDHRTGQRFPLHLPIRVQGQSTSQRPGETGNVSAAGVYIWLEGEPEIGSNIQFEITIPSQAIGSSDDVVVRCNGRVVRSDSPSSTQCKTGVACVIDSYEFVRAALQKSGT